MLIAVCALLMLGFLALKGFPPAPAYQAIPVKVSENRLNRR
jgi:hypothetical protein